MSGDLAPVVFGQAAYDVMLADCSWHVLRMPGRLSGRVYLLAP